LERIVTSLGAALERLVRRVHRALEIRRLNRASGQLNQEMSEVLEFHHLFEEPSLAPTGSPVGGPDSVGLSSSIDGREGIPMSTQAVAIADGVVSRHSDVHSGSLVFAGTRVPVETLIEVLKAGGSIGDFLEGYPSVSRWQVETFLELSTEAVDYLRSLGPRPA